MRECYYFPHFADARNDPKILRLLMNHGMAGYGIFWALLENLRTAKEYAIAYDCIAIAYQFQSNPEQIKSIVEDFGLFMNDGNLLWSPSLKIRLEERSEKYRLNALQRKDYSSNMKPKDMLQHSNSQLNYAKKEKESKVKESKVKERVIVLFSPPNSEEVSNYCKERNNNINPQSFIDFYSSKGWMVGKNKMKDWKASIRTWENRNKNIINKDKWNDLNGTSR